jgi:hypothetical protein
MHTQKIIAQLLSSPRSYSLPKSTTYTVVKSKFLGLQWGCTTGNAQMHKCTGNGLVVPSWSHKREVAGSIPGWVHQNFSPPSSAVTSPTEVIL